MKKNMSGLDRSIRVILALVIAGLYFTETITGVVGIVFSLFAVVFLLTSAVSWCPLYSLFGISSCAKS